MKKLLFVTNNSSHGGAERMLVWLANKMSEHMNYKVFFCNMNNNMPFYKLSEAVEVLLYNRPINENYLYRNTLGFISKSVFLLKIIKKQDIDIVINFNDHAYYNILLCRIFAKFKILISQRVDPAAITSKTGKLRLYLVKFADGLVCQTDPAAKFFKGHFTKDIQVIWNPVYNIPSVLWNLKNTDNTIINVARLELKQKRQDILLKAFAIVHEKYPSFKLLLYGAKIDDDYKVIMRNIKELKLEANVEYCGISKDIISEMRKAKMLVLSSDYEGIPNAILEGMSLGMPIVSTDCKPGGARMLLEGGYGILTKCGDAEALADAILSVLDDPIYAEKMGQEAFKSVKRFDEYKIANQWYSYINNIIS